MSRPTPKPPRLARKLLGLLAGPELSDYVEGDLNEEFHDRVTRSPVRARLWYWRQVLSLDLMRSRRESPWRGAPPVEGQRAGWFPDLMQETRRAVRTLAGRPAFAVIVITVLGLGIALCSVGFAVVQAVFLEPLPFVEPERLVVIWRDGTRVGGGPKWSWSPAYYDAFRDETRFHASMAASFPFPAALVSRDGAESVSTARVSADFFDVFGVPAAMGRTFAPGERRVVVLSHALWERSFGSDTNVVSRDVVIEDLNPLRDPEASAERELYTVVGVMPRTFSVPMSFAGPAVPAGMWIPFHPEEAMPNPRTSALNVVARLEDGVALERARAEARAAYADIERRFPDHSAGGVRLVPLYEDTVGDVRASLWVLTAAGVFVVLIVLANLGNLFVTRGIVRSGELALRAALGASSARLARLVLTESILLCTASALLGSLLARALLPVALRIMPDGIPRLENARIDAFPLGIAIAVAAVSAMVFTMLSMLTWHRRAATAWKLSDRSGARAGRRLQNASVLVQTAVTVVLLVASGLSAQSLRNLLAVDPGFEGEQRLTFHLRLPQARYPDDVGKIQALTEMHRLIEAVPGVVASGSSDQIPPNRGGSGGEFTSLSRSDPIHMALRTVTHHYLEALGLPVVEGRGFRESDDRSSDDVVLLSESAAQLFYPGVSPIGRTVSPAPLPVDGPWPKTIVGVVPDLPTFTVDGAPFPEIYQLHEQAPWGQHKFVVHVRGDALSHWAGIRDAVREVDPQLPLVEVRRLDELVARSLSRPVFLGSILGLFTVAALVLSAVGTFGVLSYVVAQRMREVAVRLAVGASPRRIAVHFVRGVVTVSSLGILGGLVAAILGRSLIASQLYDVSANDPTSYLTAATVALAASILAALPVARRASSTDPARVLKLD